MIDHLAINVTDLQKSGCFYDNALKPIGYKKLMDSPQEFAGSLVLGWGDSDKTDLWISEGIKTTPLIHLAFRAQNRKQVDDFYNEALKHGGIDNGAPAIRSQYHEYYYGAFVFDPDGHNIEAVCHNLE